MGSCNWLVAVTLRLGLLLLQGVIGTECGSHTMLHSWSVHVIAASVQGRQGVQQGCQGCVGERGSEVSVCCARRGRGVAGMMVLQQPSAGVYILGNMGTPCTDLQMQAPCLAVPGVLALPEDQCALA